MKVLEKTHINGKIAISGVLKIPRKVCKFFFCCFSLLKIKFTPEIVVEVCFFKPHVFVASRKKNTHLVLNGSVGLCLKKTNTSTHNTSWSSKWNCQLRPLRDFGQMMCYQCEQTNAGRGCTTTGAPFSVVFRVFSGSPLDVIRLLMFDLFNT